MEPTRALKLIALIMGLFICACTSVNLIPFTAPYAPHKGIVKVFSSPPNTQYEEIGFISATGDEMVSWEQLLTLLLNKAASCGANGVIIRQSTKAGDSIFYMPNSRWGMFMTESKKVLSGVAIRINNL